MTEVFVIWSNQHRAWWRPHRRGYTQMIEEAGRYPRGEAEAIIKDATLDGELVHPRLNPITEETYEALDEYMLVAPECITDKAGDPS